MASTESSQTCFQLLKSFPNPFDCICIFSLIYPWHTLTDLQIHAKNVITVKLVQNEKCSQIHFKFSRSLVGMNRRRTAKDFVKFITRFRRNGPKKVFDWPSHYQLTSVQFTLGEAQPCLIEISLFLGDVIHYWSGNNGLYRSSNEWLYTDTQHEWLPVLQLQPQVSENCPLMFCLSTLKSMNFDLGLQYIAYPSNEKLLNSESVWFQSHLC